MRTEKDVEAYLTRMNRRFSRVESSGGDGTTFLVSMGSHSDSAGESHTSVPCALRVESPLVVARANLGALVEGPKAAELMRILLAHNAKTLVHSSFGLEGERVVLSSAHQLENLDYNELEATLDEMDVTLAGEFSKFEQYLKKA